MADLQNVLRKDGFGEVMTYIQSGNIIVATPLSTTETAKQIQSLIAGHFGFSTEVFVYDELQLATILANSPFDNQLPGNRVFLTILATTPTPEAIGALQSMDLGAEKLEIKDNVAYFYLPDGMATSKLSNNLIEKKLQVKSTGRNRNTMERMFALLTEEPSTKNT